MTESRLGLTRREPVVAGMFYPADPRDIAQTLDQWWSDAPEQPERWRAAIAPHAGWGYSGRIAAEVIQRIDMPSTIVVLCPKHRPGGAECAIAPWQRWDFPGGSLEADEELSERLAEEVSLFELDDRPHRQEHAIEVQLPLIARQAPRSKLVAITVGRIGWEDCLVAAAELSRVLQDRLDDTLLLISSDMNHFASDEENRQLDSRALDALEQLDPAGLYQTCQRYQISMCGMLPAVIVLSALSHLDSLHRAIRVAYATSADAGGDTQRVVGYAGMLFN